MRESLSAGLRPLLTWDDADEEDKHSQHGGGILVPGVLPGEGGEDGHGGAHEDDGGARGLGHGEGLAEEEEGQRQRHGDDDLIQQVLHGAGRVCAAHGGEHGAGRVQEAHDGQHPQRQVLLVPPVRAVLDAPLQRHRQRQHHVQEDVELVHEEFVFATQHHPPTPSTEHVVS